MLFRALRFFTSLAFFAPIAAYAQEIYHGVKPYQLGFQDAASPTMEKLTWLHNSLLTPIITVITVFVMVLLAYIALRFNRRANPVASKTTHNVRLEVIWTVIPILILVAIAIPSLRTHYFMENTEEPGMTLKVVGHQWYWSYEYPDQGNFTFDSYMIKDKELQEGQPRLLTVDNQVVVPVNTKIRVQMTGADVLHSWAVPAFGVKRDAMPGRLNETWFKATREGVFYGQCSELCGVGHGFMPIAVKVVSQPEFASWVAEKQKENNIQPPSADPTPVETPAPANAATTETSKEGGQPVGAAVKPDGSTAGDGKPAPTKPGSGEKAPVKPEKSHF